MSILGLDVDERNVLGSLTIGEISYGCMDIINGVQWTSDDHKEKLNRADPCWEHNILIINR